MENYRILDRLNQKQQRKQQLKQLKQQQLNELRQRQLELENKLQKQKYEEEVAMRQHQQQQQLADQTSNHLNSKLASHYSLKTNYLNSNPQAVYML